ncbi:hypothetical protein LTR93_011246, partial [Exophiala xenobiotica]
SRRIPSSDPSWVLVWEVPLIRLRAIHKAFYEVICAAEKPTHVLSADGREQAIPDITPLMQPTPLGDALTYTFFDIAGLPIGGETGLLMG